MLNAPSTNRGQSINATAASSFLTGSKGQSLKNSRITKHKQSQRSKQIGVSPGGRKTSFRQIEQASIRHQLNDVSIVDHEANDEE